MAIFLCVLILANAYRFFYGDIGGISVFGLLGSPALLIVLAGIAGYLIWGLGKKGGEGK